MGTERTVTWVPAHEIVSVVSGPRPDDKRMVDVRWNAKLLVTFAEDIQMRGEEINEKQASA